MTRPLPVLAAGLAGLLALPTAALAQGQVSGGGSTNGASAALMPSSQAQPATPQRVRGTVEQIAGDTLTVKSRGGDDVTVSLRPGWTVLAVVPSSLSAITPGTYVGAAATGPDSALVAKEVVVFPATMKGSGEGHYPWDLMPGSTMTNATVESEVQQSSGRVLTLGYKGQTVKMTVPAGAPVVSFEPGDKTMLASGAHVFIGGTAGPNGSVEASRVAVGKGGLTPPM